MGIVYKAEDTNIPTGTRPSVGEALIPLAVAIITKE